MAAVRARGATVHL